SRRRSRRSAGSHFSTPRRRSRVDQKNRCCLFSAKLTWRSARIGVITMRALMIAAITGAMIGPLAAQTCNTIGSQTFCDNGLSANRIGGTTFWSDGTTANRIGGTTYFSDGTTANQIGGTTFYSDGTTANQIGGTTFFSNGTTCQRIGSSVFCN